MAKLYPPYINGTIPAFFYTGGTADTKIAVPFTMNRAVAAGEVAGFALKIKTINGDVKGVIFNNNINTIVGSNASVTFSTDMTFLVGQYYKVQLAYISADGVIGYYSTVGIAKCTTKPIVEIEGLQFGQTNNHRYSYTGIYSQFEGDVTEKMYSYQFVLYDGDNNVVANSGERLHNTTFDNLPYESHEEFKFDFELQEEQAYYVQFIVTTTNGLVIQSLKYKIAQRKTVKPTITANLIAGRDFNNGYVILSFSDETSATISGTFLISRASDKNNWHWEELKRIDLHAASVEAWRLRDYTVEQGITYKYAIQQYNAQGIYSDKIISNIINMDFEDMFLYDGERQLRIRFNPKVASFKTDLLETKTDTIGSKYPFFSRNGNVNYKEFSLSGLISYLSDENENFISMKKLGLDGFADKNDYYGRYHTTNLLDYNIAAERMFKHEVLDWLNNGQVKMFKSPAEGNFLVRLMNVSLTPMDQVSRMLHTFSATAYEVADFNLDNLGYYGLVDAAENLEVRVQWVTTDIHAAVQTYLQTTGKTLEEAIGDKISLIKQNAISINFTDIIPGSHVIISSEDIEIGATGAYSYQVNNDIGISQIEYVIDYNNQGLLTYSFLTQTISTFGLISDIQLLDTPAEQIIGRTYLKNALVWDSATHTFNSSVNVLDALNDVRTSVTDILRIRAEKREIITLYIKDNFSSSEEKQLFLTANNNLNYQQYNFYTDMYCENKDLFNWTTANPLALYRIRFQAKTSPHDTKKNYKYYVDANLDQFSELTNVCIDGLSKQFILYNDDLFKFTINNEVIDLAEVNTYKLNSAKIPIEYIELNDGVVLDMMSFKQITIFNVELDDIKYEDLVFARLQYLIQYNNMINTRAIGEHYDTALLDEAYRTYIIELNKALDSYREENGLALQQ